MTLEMPDIKKKKKEMPDICVCFPRVDGQVVGSTDALSNQLTRTPAHSYEARKNLRCCSQL